MADNDPGYGQLFAILMRRRLWLLGTFLGVTVLALLFTLLQKPTHRSSMQLLVEPNYQSKREPGEKRTAESEFTDTNVEIDSATQINLMRSSGLLQRAVTLLQPEYPDIKIDEVREALSVSQVVANDPSTNKKVNTKIFQIAYTDSDPIKTQKVLEALQKVYQDYNLEQQELRLTKGLSFIKKQLPVVRDKVKVAESNLEQFRKSQNLVDPELQSKALVDSLSRIRQDQQANNAQMRDLAARYVTLQQQLAMSPPQALVASRLSQSARYQNLLNEIQKTELALEQERTRFEDVSPFVQKLVDQRQRQLALLQGEVRRVLQADVSADPDRLRSEGQLGTIDLTLVGQLIDAQVNLQAAQSRAQSLAQAEQRIRDDLRRFPALLTEYGRLQPEVQANRETLEELLKAEQDIGLEIARGGFDWQVVEEPLEGEKIAPSLPKNLLLGMVAGLMLGGVAAFVREAIDDSVHSSDELKKQVALPLLGMVPEATPTEANQSPTLSFRKSQELAVPTLEVVQGLPFRESLDLLYQNLQLLNASSQLKSLVVTSALAGEGKTTLALGLAISAARLHQRVLLIDADLRRPSLHKLLELPNDRGLSTLLASDTPILDTNDLQLSNPYGNLSVLSAGPTPTDPAKLLSSHRMQEVLNTFEQHYDLVLLDAPPVLGIVDTILTASACSGVVLVGRIGRVTRTELTHAIAALHQLNVIGVIANGADNPVYNYASYVRSA
ncbi:MAG: polysaccharide biosynthesis tyrosine autokinase [Scytolyngbya sp. HA4215-MV1]|jgi:capsular exopolysaccharide synthesis family protein|nr:polysaccharide biosynthesis tyrosine autokinase [Scytolyngbya sp. HA4215-MV1]